MNKEQEISQLKERARNAKRKGHLAQAKELRAKILELEGPRKKPAKKVAAPKPPKK